MDIKQVSISIFGNTKNIVNFHLPVFEKCFINPLKDRAFSALDMEIYDKVLRWRSKSVDPSIFMENNELIKAMNRIKDFMTGKGILNVDRNELRNFLYLLYLEREGPYLIKDFAWLLRITEERRSIIEFFDKNNLFLKNEYYFQEYISLIVQDKLNCDELIKISNGSDVGELNRWLMISYQRITDLLRNLDIKIRETNHNTNNLKGTFNHINGILCRRSLDGEPFINSIRSSTDIDRDYMYLVSNGKNDYRECIETIKRYIKARIYEFLLNDDNDVRKCLYTMHRDYCILAKKNYENLDFVVLKGMTYTLKEYSDWRFSFPDRKDSEKERLRNYNRAARYSALGSLFSITMNVIPISMHIPDYSICGEVQSDFEDKVNLYISEMKDMSLFKLKQELKHLLFDEKLLANTEKKTFNTYTVIFCASSLLKRLS